MQTETVQCLPCQGQLAWSHHDEDTCLIVEMFHGAGKCIARHVGPTQAERLAAHEARQCDGDCGYGYEEASAEP